MHCAGSVSKHWYFGPLILVFSGFSSSAIPYAYCVSSGITHGSANVNDRRQISLKIPARTESQIIIAVSNKQTLFCNVPLAGVSGGFVLLRGERASVRHRSAAVGS
jgi:hypothetical protein